MGTFRALLGSLAGVLLAAQIASTAHAEHRVALVIGNDQYAHFDAAHQLAKAVNDANAVGDALEHDGFTVIRGSNLSRSDMVDKLFDLTSQIQPGDLAFFYFAGHGVALSGGNYILPSDVPAAEEGQELRIASQSLAEADIVATLQDKGARVSIIVLDACRDNPFKRPGVRSIGLDRGLSLVRASSAKGLFSLYSAGFGEEALDRLSDADANPNSVFTRVFVPLLTEPGLSLDDLASEVREKVADLAATTPDHHEQIPAAYSQVVGGRIYLGGGPAEGTTVARAELPAPTATETPRRIAVEPPSAPPPPPETIAPPPPTETTAPPVSGTTPTLLRELVGLKGDVFSLAFSADDSKLLTGSADSTARVWDVASGKELLKIADPPPVNAIEVIAFVAAFSPDQLHIATGSYESRAEIWNRATGDLLFKMGAGPLTAIAYSPDGRRLATVGLLAEVWDPQTGKFLFRLGQGGAAPDNSFRSVAYSPDSRRIATGAEDGTIKIWDASTGDLLINIEHTPHGSFPSHFVETVAFAPDGRRLLTADVDGMVEVWDVVSGNLLLSIEHGGMALGAAFSPDGRTIASVWHSLSLWDATTGKSLASVETDDDTLAFSHDGKLIATGGAGTNNQSVHIWSTSPVSSSQR